MSEHAVKTVKLEMSDVSEEAQSILIKECKGESYGVTPEFFLDAIVDAIRLNPHDPVGAASEKYIISKELAQAVLDAMHAKQAATH